MKRLLVSALLAALPLLSLAQVNVNVGLNIGDPNFYGQIEVGHDLPRPMVLAKDPVIVRRALGAAYAPVYLRVPLTHSQNWSRFCTMYSACSQPVFFVQDQWYQREYVPKYRNRYSNDNRRYEVPRGRNEQPLDNRRNNRQENRWNDQQDNRWNDRQDNRWEDRRDNRWEEREDNRWEDRDDNRWEERRDRSENRQDNPVDIFFR